MVKEQSCPVNALKPRSIKARPLLTETHHHRQRQYTWLTLNPRPALLFILSTPSKRHQHEVLHRSCPLRCWVTHLHSTTCTQNIKSNSPKLHRRSPRPGGRSLCPQLQTLPPHRPSHWPSKRHPYRPAYVIPQQLKRLTPNSSPQRPASPLVFPPAQPAAPPLFPRSPVQAVSRPAFPPVLPVVFLPVPRSPVLLASRLVCLPARLVAGLLALRASRLVCRLVGLARLSPVASDPLLPRGRRYLPPSRSCGGKNVGSGGDGRIVSWGCI